MRQLVIVALVAAASACSSDKSAQTAEASPVEQTDPVSDESAGESAPAGAPQTAPESGATMVPPTEAAIAARIADAKSRLGADPAGKLVWDAIQTQGGLEPWFSNGLFHFRFAYKPKGRDATDTYQLIDTYSALARHEVAPRRTTAFGWDGSKAWVFPADAEVGTNPRFWALTPYYFVGIPFVLADPGVNFERLEDAEFEGETYDLVKATFDAGTGDAPGDYYILYLDKEDRRVRAIRYVVSYPGFYPDGGHGAEKLMAYDGDATAAGLTFATAHRTFEFDEETGEIGEKVTDVAVTEIQFMPNMSRGVFQIPTGAKVIEGWK